MAAGLFELRKDAITGWWVATVVDRAFHRDRFALRAAAVDDGGHCQNCTDPPGEGVRVRTLKDYAFHVVGTDAEARALDASVVQVALSQAKSAGSWRTVVAAPEEHRPLHAVGTDTIAELLTSAGPRSATPRRPARPSTSRSSRTGAPRPVRGRTTSVSTCTTSRRSRIGSPRSWAERPGSSSARVAARGAGSSRTRPRAAERLIHQDDASVAFAPYASRSPFEIWIVPRRHDADFGRATDAEVQATADSLRRVLTDLATLDGPPYNLVLHTAPLKEQVDGTFHWHWEIHPRLREIAGLEIGTGLPVNPVSPEDAVDELLRQARGADVRATARSEDRASGGAASG